MKKLLSIDGMSCKHCVTHVKNALEEVIGVKSVDVDLNKKAASIEGECLDDKALIHAVNDIGYKVTWIS